jgi:uncharacterized membrane protein YeaQ/YmgE (transglycosylase-associated protein family)
MEQYFAHKALLVTICIGAVAGLFAQMFVPGKGFGIVPTIVIGIIGCYLGNMFISHYLTMIDNKTLKDIVSGTLGAMVLSLVINIFRIGSPKHKDKTKWRNNA